MRFHKLIAQNIAWRGLYYFSQFILNILISRYFKADGSGEIYYAINNLSFLLLIIGFSFESGATYYIAKNEINGKKIAFFLLTWVLFVIPLSIFLFDFTISTRNVLHNKPELITAYCFYVTGFLLITYFSALFFARQNFFLSNFILFISNLVFIVFFIVFNGNVFIHDHFIFIFFGTFLLQGSILAVIYIFQDPRISGDQFISRKEFQKLISYSGIALISNIIFFLVYRVDYWFVKLYCSESELGNYIQVSKLGQMFFVIPSIIGSVIFPIIASGQQQAKTILKTVGLMLFVVYFFFCLLLIATGKWLFPFIYGGSFEKMYLPFIFSVPGILSLSMLYPFTAYYSGIKKIGVNIAGSLLALSFIIIGDIIIIPRSGIAGAALVSSFGYLIYQFYVFLIFSREYKVAVTDLFYASPAEMKKIYSLIMNYISKKRENG
jgi:O-antigen/teichoic acid export membrane protein